MPKSYHQKFEFEWSEVESGTLGYFLKLPR